MIIIQQLSIHLSILSSQNFNHKNQILFTMSIIKNVAFVGPSGALGAPVLDVLIKSNKFNITVLTRSTSKSTSHLPTSVTNLPVDFTSVESLTSALKSQNIDAVVSCVGAPGLKSQSVLIDASVAAGVKRFLPSEFGSDLSNPLTKSLPVFGDKITTQEYLEAAVAKNPSLTYTYVRNGSFLDWGLEHKLLLDLTSGKPTIYDGGDVVFSSTTLETIGQAVVGVLGKFEETKNRAVYIQDIQITQNRLLELAKKVAPEKQWEPVHAETAKILASSNEKLAKGEVTMEVMLGYIVVSLFGKEYGGKIEKTDNELLGLKEKTDADVEAILKKLIK
ncbi:7b9d34ae-6f7f-4e02-a433-f5227adeb13a [Sclerotinia trifoliorum]|uniref:7b9d34ae-6f7f-4e02-a433-f5227adeb13a n=1 Tax=Sclerotinia trifoliorum TaxID=28548 RepID=A0A8H2ZM22_9HELO|nr:7b9d34ae-6f7f-4e02-a433-f5227adeb13a [Sclerotinia trifoliorum]